MQLEPCGCGAVKRGETWHWMGMPCRGCDHVGRKMTWQLACCQPGPCENMQQQAACQPKTFRRLGCHMHVFKHQQAPYAQNACMSWGPCVPNCRRTWYTQLLALLYNRLCIRNCDMLHDARAMVGGRWLDSASVAAPVPSAAPPASLPAAATAAAGAGWRAGHTLWAAKSAAPAAATVTPAAAAAGGGLVGGTLGPAAGAGPRPSSLLSAKEAKAATGKLLGSTARRVLLLAPLLLRTSNAPMRALGASR
jgi:hypothetical protein